MSGFPQKQRLQSSMTGVLIIKRAHKSFLTIKICKCQKTGTFLDSGHLICLTPLQVQPFFNYKFYMARQIRIFVYLVNMHFIELILLLYFTCSHFYSFKRILLDSKIPMHNCYYFSKVCLYGYIIMFNIIFYYALAEFTYSYNPWVSWR